MTQLNSDTRCETHVMQQPMMGSNAHIRQRLFASLRAELPIQRPEELPPSPPSKEMPTPKPDEGPTKAPPEIVPTPDSPETGVPVIDPPPMQPNAPLIGRMTD